jgi:hypothetical protein
MNPKVILNTIIAVILFLILSVYAVNFTIPWPKDVVVYFEEPIIKAAAYFAVYLTAYYNPVVSVLLLMLVLFLHVNEVMIINKI